MQRAILGLVAALLASPAAAIDEFVVHEEAKERGVVFSMEDVIDAVAAHWPNAEVVTVETVTATDRGLAAAFRVQEGDFVWRVNVLKPPGFIEDGVAKQGLHGGLILQDKTGLVLVETVRGQFKKPTPQPLGKKPADIARAMRAKRTDLPSMNDVPHVPKEQRIKRDLSRHLTPAPVARSKRKRQPDYLAEAPVPKEQRIKRRDLPDLNPRAVPRSQRVRNPAAIEAGH